MWNRSKALVPHPCLSGIGDSVAGTVQVKGLRELQCRKAIKIGLPRTRTGESTRREEPKRDSRKGIV